ncbi:MAG: MCE family protein [Candidatus Eremiobacteraeota bacterium]|nr:MCE family protein [Candidatus Eremiobacteraeota bacterium]
MSRQALVGIFTVLALLGLFAVFVVLENYGTQGRYKIGVHFKSAAGLHKGALVYESGVVVGTVDQTVLLPEDFTVDVIMAINNNVDVPRNARFLIQAPLTGDSTVEIVPQVLTKPKPFGVAAPTNAPAAVAVLPHEVQPLDQQPQGTNPATVQDLLEQGQGEIRRVDAMLGQLADREPKLLNTLQSALNNMNDISATTKGSFTRLSARIDSISSTLQLAVEQSSANINDLTASLDNSVRRNSGHFDAIVASLDNSARDLNRTADHVADLASDPRLKANLLETTQGIAQTATTFASIANDLHNVSGNPQTQAQLRDTVANVDAAAQKANSLLAQFGGRSSVYGVDRGATPAPAGSPRPNGTYPQPPGAPPLGSTPPPGGAQGNVKSKLAALVKDLVALQVRVSALDAQRANTDHSPLLTGDRGPQTDINVIALPKGSTWLYAGANDIGARSSWNFSAMARMSPSFSVGGGVLYSRLGARAVYSPSLTRGLGLGLEARIYDLRHPTSDAYANLGVGNGLTLFGGERDIFHSGRRTTFGLQYQF